MANRTALEEIIIAEILQNGPVSLARYIDLCLSHPAHGYYMSRDPFGFKGDFTTAPEISQMFGELIGLWCAQIWLDMGQPGKLGLVELGPGRGTLMSDALRAMKTIPGLHETLDIYLVETSPFLRKTQSKTLEKLCDRVTWLEDLNNLPNQTSIFIANEFFDALPVHQFQWNGTAWHERVIGLDDEHKLCIGLTPEPVLPAESFSTESPPHSECIKEVCPATREIVANIAGRIRDSGGAALIIDYGYDDSDFGDTLQAVKKHKYVAITDSPGDADLTTHVDFGALRQVAHENDVKSFGPIGQGTFLEAMGIRTRAQALAKHASESQKSSIQSALKRLTDPASMGDLFRVLVLCSEGAAPPPPFQELG